MFPNAPLENATAVPRKPRKDPLTAQARIDQDAEIWRRSQNGWPVGRIAKLLKIGPATVYRRLSYMRGLIQQINEPSEG